MKIEDNVKRKQNAATTLCESGGQLAGYLGVF